MIMVKYLLLLVCFSLLSACEESKELNNAQVESLATLVSITSHNANSTLSGSENEIELSAQVFTICNEKIYVNNPDIKRLTRLAVQEALYALPITSLTNGAFEDTVKMVTSNPALDMGISPIFISLYSPTTTQADIFEDDYLAFKNSLVELYELTDEFVKSEEKNRSKYSDKEFTRLAVMKLPHIACFSADFYLSLFDYSQVNGFNTIAREAAIKMLSNTRKKAISDVTKRLRNYN
ncbi:hypothetical protein [Pseudoalteromonas sp. KAN5]|uniref:hypothetical protein n=1 Tax=Pseudoalteromonas sp. KAN5 TaxID=2916633 RepID=UPI001FCC7CC4|nr:hypothetical protein [Pseudoalteromonas sp. KAN5]BDF96484.1 hypothetical protein KAN5_33220 [Pseudoalteromonas sp. KAN5]